MRPALTLFSMISLLQPVLGQWQPPAPEPDEFDWIQLNSGEWLKGEIVSLYDDTLDFESEELDDLKIDFEDIRTIRSAGLQMVNIAPPEADAPSGPFSRVRKLSGIRPDEILTGFVRLEGETMKVITRNGVEHTLNRDRVISLAAGEPREADYWTAKASLGANVRTGNVEQRELNTRATVRRISAYSNFYFQYVGNFSRTDDIQTANNHRVTSYYDRFITRAFFWRTVTVEYFKDPFQNIASRGTVGSSIGWHIMDTDRFKWDVAGGPAYQYVSFDTVEAGEADQEESLALTLSTNYEYKVNRKVTLIGNYSLFYAGRKAGGYTLHTDTTLETELLTWLDFDVSVIWDYQSDPVGEVTGNVPKRSDVQLVFSLSVDL